MELEKKDIIFAVTAKNNGENQTLDSIQYHIDYLARRHECVILPGIGAVISSCVSAHYDEEKGLLSPPFREYTFNSEIKSNDGLLANSISRRRKIGYDEAVVAMKVELDEIKRRLEDDKEVNIGSLGSIIIRDGRKEFIPFISSEERNRRIGLDSLRIGEKMDVELAGEGADSNVVSSEEDIAVTESTLSERMFDTRRYYYIPIRKKAVKIVASVALVMGVGLSIFLPFTARNGVERDYASVVPVKEVTVAKENTGAKIEEEAQELPISQIAETDYRVVVGTFTTEGEMERFMAAHSASPYKLEVLRQGKLIYAVAAASSSMEEMREFKRDGGFKAEYPNAWILDYSKE